MLLIQRAFHYLWGDLSSNFIMEIDPAWTNFATESARPDLKEFLDQDGPTRRQMAEISNTVV